MVGPVTFGSGVLSAQHPAVLRKAARGGSPAPAATPLPPATSDSRCSLRLWPKFFCLTGGTA